MSEVVEIRDIKAASGEKTTGFLEIAGTATTEVKIPVAIINGLEAGPKLCVTAGVHCTEYEGIEAAIRLFQKTKPEDLKGTLIICPVVNTPGFQHGTLYNNPLDSKNINRIYPGDPDGTISEKMIHVVLNELILKCDYHIDLHGGESTEDMGHFVNYTIGVGTKDVEEKTAEMARYFLPNVIQPFDRNTGTSSSEVSRVGIPCIMPQAGGLSLYREKDIKFHLRGINNVMRWLGMLPNEGPPEEPDDDIPTFIGNHYVRVRKGGIFYPKLRGEDTFKEGDVMAEVKDLFGNVIEEVIAPTDGVVCYYFPKRVKTSGDPAYSIWTP